MKNILSILSVVAIIIFVAACNSNEKNSNELVSNEKSVDTTKSIVKVDEAWISHWDDKDNIDSPAFWKSPAGETWVIATAKEADVLVIYDAQNGSELKRVMKSGSGKSELRRPNGIKVIDDLALIVERDNQRVQVFSLPDFQHIGFIGDSLINPYGLDCYKKDGVYYLYVTDNYETLDEKIPPLSDLGKRVHLYSFTLENGAFNSELIRKFGATEDPGALYIVESVMVDPDNDQVVFAEEDETQGQIKVYDLDGNFTGKTFGYGYFEGQAEGIALYKTNKNDGWWICTDQSKTNNNFNVFDRKSFKYIGTFAGDSTSNTDGVALTQNAFGGFKMGAFFACDDDGGITAFSIKVIQDSLK
jgi:3-phytase